MLLEARVAKDAVVHHQQAEFGPAQIPDVDDFGDEKPLGNVVNGVLGNVLHVVADSFNVHGKSDAQNNPVPHLTSQHTGLRFGVLYLPWKT